jgi:exopolysaccharide biosynthesis predicted pyruvyltransferase EpsI
MIRVSIPGASATNTKTYAELNHDSKQDQTMLAGSNTAAVNRDLSSGTSCLRPVQEELSRFRDRPVYFEPLWGNNGDELIRLGSRVLMRRAGVRRVPSPEEAELIVVNGGAAINDFWYAGLPAVEEYNKRFPQTPLMLFPQTYHFYKTDFAAIFKWRSAPAYLYARDRRSLEELHRFTFPAGIRTGVDHDTAFYTSRSRYVTDLRRRMSERYILIVERDDDEGVKTLKYQPVAPQRLRAFVPRPLRKTLKQALLSRGSWKRNEQTPFALAGIDAVKQEHSRFSDLPIYAADVSREDIFTFRRFGEVIAGAAAVVTNRIHAGILAGLLGKPTYLAAGPWHKIPAIYDFSLRDAPHVHLLPPRAEDVCATNID